MDVEMIAGQQVQRGLVRQRKTKRLRVVRVAMNRGELVWRRSLGLDTCDRVHALILRAWQSCRNRDSMRIL